MGDRTTRLLLSRIRRERGTPRGNHRKLDGKQATIARPRPDVSGASLTMSLPCQNLSRAVVPATSVPGVYAFFESSRSPGLHATRPSVQMRKRCGCGRADRHGRTAASVASAFLWLCIFGVDVDLNPPAACALLARVIRRQEQGEREAEGAAGGAAAAKCRIGRE